MFVHPHDNIQTLVDARLLTRGGFFDTHFRHTGFDGLGHSSQRLHFLDDLPRLLDDTAREGFDIVRTPKGIHHMTDLGFLLNDNLGVSGYSGRKIGWQTHGFIK